ncbi:MAG: efflux RND transporter periplasmic adaptor subunit [Thermodesulfobacteriota bacterium]
MISDKTRMVFLLIAGFGLLLAACGKEKEVKATKEVVRPIKMMNVTSGADAIQLKFPGMVRAAKRADLAFQVGGTLRQFPLDEGQLVKEGQLIGQLDQRDFLNNLRNARGQLEKAKAALESARSEYDRILRIQKQDPGAASESMVVLRRQALDQSKAEIESAQAAVDTARDQLGYTTLQAPFGGVVSKRYVDNYQEIHAKEPIVSLDDVSSVEILVDLPELIVATLTADGESQVMAEFAAAPGKRYPLAIKERAMRADPKTQTYQVVFLMPQPDDINVLPGMTATVTGVGRMQEERKEPFIVPAVAIVADMAGKPSVWIVDKETSKVQRRAVKTGDLTGTDSIEIIDGLKSGETIAISGVSRLREGMRVKDLTKMEGYTS